MGEIGEEEMKKIKSLYRVTHLAVGLVAHVVPTRGGMALCGRRPALSVGWSKNDDERITCPRCLKRGNEGTLPEYRRAR